MATTSTSISSTSNKIANYNGRSYRLLWVGVTKYGRRAHLSFMDGSKDFWVDASRVSEQAAEQHTSSTTVFQRHVGHGRCRECGGEIKDAPHHRAMGGLCGDCAFDEYDC